MELTPEIRLSIEKSVLCWLATVSSEGIPNVSPKEIFCAHGTEQVLVANIASPQTLQNIKSNPQVCISFIDILLQKGYQLKGKAEVVFQSDERFETLSKPLIFMTQGQFPFGSLTSIQIESAKPIIAPRYLLYPETTEKAQIESARKLYGL